MELLQSTLEKIKVSTSKQELEDFITIANFEGMAWVESARNQVNEAVDTRLVFLKMIGWI